MTRLEQSSRDMEDSSSAVKTDQRENSTSMLEYCRPVNFGTCPSALSELNQADSTIFLRGMLLISNGSDNHSKTSQDPKAENLSIADCMNTQNTASILNQTCVLTQEGRLTSGAVLVQEKDLLDRPRVDIETSLIDFVCQDKAESLSCLLRKIVQVLKAEGEALGCKANEFQGVLDYWFPHRLLHLACQLDSVACAQTLLGGDAGLPSPVNGTDDNGKTALHYAASNLSTRCVELLLQKRAKADLSSKDGCIPLKMALQNKRWPANLQHLPAAELIRFLRTQDLTAIKLLACHTKDLLRQANSLAFDGHSAALTALILATGNSLLGQDQDYESFLDLVVEKALFRSIELMDSPKNGKSSSKVCDSSESEGEAQRYSVLKCLEIIVRLRDDLAHSTTYPVCKPPLRRKPPALLRAAQAGDEIVIRILLTDSTYVHDTDSEGNTALHWCLKTTKGLRIIWQLVTLGSAVGARNKLGYTPVHIAAGHGHLQALQLLLAQDPNAVHISAVTRETPLFLAVKNNHIECVRLLLQFGSNLQALNLRRQRPVDFAHSQDMRVLLSENGTFSIGTVKQNSDLKFLNTTLPRHQTPADDGATLLENGLMTNMHIDRFTNSQEELDDSKLLLKRQHTKTALCRYHMMPGGCARGEGCFYAHSEQELQSEIHEKAKLTEVYKQRKIFVGGLSPAMGSEDLKDFFEADFGPVEEAIVMSTQTGGHTQSRGFGFVTFVNEASCIAAVREHYLTIYGKKVEIKAAFQPSKKTNEDMLNIHSCSNSPRSISHLQGTFKDVNWSNATKGHRSTVLKTGEAAVSTHQSKIAPSLGPFKMCQPPNWLPVFKKWLPAFLSAASARQGGPECYPLSSIKADFRATCGMELDHTALGFPKLSDFLRTMPELCKMKIVPVGRGPATHVVLQMRQQSSVPRPAQRTMGTKIVTSSLVHEGRTYAAAAGHNIATSSRTSNCLQSKTFDDAAGPIKVQPITDTDPKVGSVYENNDFSIAASNLQGRILNNYDGQQQATYISDDSCLLYLSDRKEPQQNHKEKVPTVEAFAAWQQDLSGDNLARQHSHPQLTNVPMMNEFSNPDTPPTQPSQQQDILSSFDFCHNPYMQHTNPRVHPPLQSKPAVPSYGQDAVSLYNPWSFNLFEGCRNLIQQMNLAASGEESPQSSLTSEDSLDSPCGVRETPPVPCVICGDKAAVWVALPCAHKAICSPCKHQLQEKNQSLRQCFVCRGNTREWMAHY